MLQNHIEQLYENWNLSEIIDLYEKNKIQEIYWIFLTSLSYYYSDKIEEALSTISKIQNLPFNIDYYYFKALYQLELNKKNEWKNTFFYLIENLHKFENWNFYKIDDLLDENQESNLLDDLVEGIFEGEEDVLEKELEKKLKKTNSIETSFNLLYFLYNLTFENKYLKNIFSLIKNNNNYENTYSFLKLINYILDKKLNEILSKEEQIKLKEILNKIEQDSKIEHSYKFEKDLINLKKIKQHPELEKLKNEIDIDKLNNIFNKSMTKVESFLLKKELEFKQKQINILNEKIEKQNEWKLTILENNKEIELLKTKNKELEELLNNKLEIKEPEILEISNKEIEVEKKI